MKLTQLITREIAHRKLTFGLSVLAIAVAAIALVAADMVVRADALATDRILSAKQAETEEVLAEKIRAVAAAGADLEEAMRKHMKGLGFNVLILPEQQDPAELHLSGSLSETMPASYADRLGDSSIMTINHLLPTVLKQVKWPEQELEVILYGTRGEVPLMHRAMKKPVLDAVAPGQMVVGWSIHQKLGLQVGQEVEFFGRKFTVSVLHPERGSTDDVTLWIDLNQAQEILGLQNLIHAILALECDCAGDRISEIRREIAGILPGTQVIERHSQALARAEARTKAKLVAEESLAAEQEASAATLQRERAARAELEAQHQQVAQIVIPLVLLLAVAAVGVLAFNNVRYRREEIGILRALGLRTSQVLYVFLGKAVLSGIVGGVLGVVIGLLGGWAVTHWVGDWPADSQLLNDLLASPGFVFTLLSTPVLAVVLAAVASWLAAAAAAAQDAAVVLQGE